MNDTTASLRLGDLELLDDTFGARVGTSFGGWESITATTQSLFLDGAIVSGEASSNREITLRVRVEAPDRFALVEACEALLGEANKQSNTLVFTPPVGPVVVYEVFRVQSPRRIDDESEAWRYRDYELVFPALPFARSVEWEMPSALAPAVPVDDFEGGTFTGALLTETLDGLHTFGNPVGSQAATPAQEGLPALTAVTNCTVAAATVGTINGEKPVTRVTAQTNGPVEAVQSASFALGDDAASGGFNIFWTGGTRRIQAGIDWLDDADAPLRTDWGFPQLGASYNNADGRTIWVASVPPAGATRARLRLRIPLGVAGENYDCMSSVLVGSAFTAITPNSLPHTGAKSLNIPMSTGHGGANAYDAAFLYRQLTAPVTIASLGQLAAWVTPSGTAGNAAEGFAVRLFDSLGRWSRFDFTPATVAANTWGQFTAPLDAPSDTSSGGGASLADVVAYGIEAARFTGSGYLIDDLEAGPTPSATNSPRGTVFDLNDILGSAPSPARVSVSSISNLTDWLVASVEPDHGEPLLAVAGSAATAPAPALYDGTFSIVGCLSPALAVANPTCTITQKINGTTVATQTLTGTVRSGNHYVDFGAVSLPLVAVPADNQSVSFDFALAPATTSWVDLLVLDVDQSLAWIDNLSTPMPFGWVDEPEAIAGIGKVWIGAAADRSDARAPASPPTLSRPLRVKAPATRLLIYSTTTAPDVGLKYRPSWLIEPTA